MENLERAQARLENIRSVEPILGAMRTISLASWQMALNARARLQRYGERLADVLSVLPPDLCAPLRLPQRGAASPKRAVAVVIGSERGLCGRFNAVVIERAERYLGDEVDEGVEIELVALGTRMTRLLQRRHSVDQSAKLSLTTMPPYRLALNLASQWLARYYDCEIAALDLVHNTYHGMSHYAPTLTRLLPPQMPRRDPTAAGDPLGSDQEEPCPPTIVETDPISLCDRVVEQWTALGLYQALILSAAAEHSARYQLMEGATQNAERLIAELTLTIQTARQQAITREMQELAAGAGLIGSRPRQGEPGSDRGEGKFEER